MQYDVVDGGYVTFLYGSKPFARGAWPPPSVRGAYLALDCLDDTFRLRRNPEYKANRKDRRFEDHNLYEQWQRIREFRREVVEDPRLNCIRIPGLEADDIIALLAWKFAQDRELHVLAVDKDLLQIRGIAITDNQENAVTLDRFAARLPKAITREPLKRNQIPLILALIGDKSDNIPRLVPRGDLWQMSRILCLPRKKAYDEAFSVYGREFVQNLYNVLLPDPFIFDAGPMDAFGWCRNGEWGPGLLDQLHHDFVEEFESWEETVMLNRRKK